MKRVQLRTLVYYIQHAAIVIITGSLSLISQALPKTAAVAGVI